MVMLYYFSEYELQLDKYQLQSSQNPCLIAFWYKQFKHELSFLVFYKKIFLISTSLSSPYSASHKQIHKTTFW